MFPRLLLLFTVIPFLELLILIKLGSHIGALNTVFIVMGTALIGVTLLKYQGLQTIQRIRQSFTERRLPAEEVMDGFLIIVAGLCMITPGLITDLFGLSLLIPFTRKFIKGWIIRTIQKRIQRRSREIRFGRIEI